MRGGLLIGFRYSRQDFVKATGDRENDCDRFMFGPTRVRLRRSNNISPPRDFQLGYPFGSLFSQPLRKALWKLPYSRIWRKGSKRFLTSWGCSVNQIKRSPQASTLF